MQMYQQQGQLIKEQQTPEPNPLFKIVPNTREHEMTE
jgi:hypothetical protein